MAEGVACGSMQSTLGLDLYSRAGLGILVDSDGSRLFDLRLYIHLNPVRVKRLGLDKQGKLMESRGWIVPSPDEVRKRVASLRAYRWRFYPFQAGYKCAVPRGLDVTEVREMVASPAVYWRLAEDRIAHGFNEDFASRTLPGKTRVEPSVLAEACGIYSISRSRA